MYRIVACMGHVDREARNAYARAYYAANSEKHKAMVARRILERRIEMRTVVDVAKDVPCADCAGRFPIVCMDFDHLDRFVKSFTIGTVTSGRSSVSLTQLREEIAKCEVVCANCHRIRT